MCFALRRQSNLASPAMASLVRLDRAEVSRQRATERGVEEGDQRGSISAEPVLLLDLVVDLLVVGQEEEDLVLHDRPAEGEAELVLAEVGREPGGRAGREGVREVARERVVLPEVVQRAVQLVGARLGDHVHEPAAGPAELGVGSLGDHHDLLHGVQIEREGRPLAAALLAEERVVEVGAIHRDVVVDAALAADAELVAIGALHDADVRGEQGQVEEVPAVVRKPRDHLGVQPGLGGHPVRFGDGPDPFGRDFLELHGLRPEGEINGRGLAQPHHDALPVRRGVADRAGRHVVGAHPEQRPHVRAAAVGGERADVVGLDIAQRHVSAHDRRSVRAVADNAADEAGRRLCLRGQALRGRREDKEQERVHRNKRPPTTQTHGVLLGSGRGAADENC